VRIDTVARSVVGDAMLTVNTSLLRRRVAALPEVAAVHVSREWPSTLRVTISERRAVFGVQQRGEWLLVDSVATPYLTVARLPAHVLPLTVDEPTAGDLTLRAAVDVVAALPAAVRKNVVAVSAPSIAGIRLRLHDGSTVIWGGPQDSSRKARALAVLLRQPAAGNGLVRGHGHAHVYDVSTPGFVTLS
jgi:cell division protein FtsQ